MTYRTEAVTMWHDRRLAMRPSPIHGIGLFASEAIAAGERLLWVSGGIVYSSDDWRRGRVVLAADLYNEVQIGPDLFRATPKGPGYFINHSCAPNVLGGQAWRDIAADEELTTDFACNECAPDYLLAPCRCGALNCRGQVSGNDWQRPELQTRYAGFFSPYVAALIRGDEGDAGERVSG